METAEEILNPKERLGSELRDLRNRKGLSGAQLAAALGGDQSKVSRIENGKRIPSRDDITKWLDRVEADDPTRVRFTGLLEDARGWQGSFKSRMSEGQESVQRDYTELARTASLVRHVETVWVPGPLQIPDYMRRVFREMIKLHGPRDDVEASVAERRNRQQYLYDPSKQFEFLLTESVLRSPLPGPAVMRAQLAQLQATIGAGNVRFGVIPENVTLEITPQNKVEVYVTDDGPQVVVELARGEHWFEEPDEIAFYQRWIDLLWEEALEGDVARERIARATQELTE